MLPVDCSKGNFCKYTILQGIYRTQSAPITEQRYSGPRFIRLSSIRMSEHLFHSQVAAFQSQGYGCLLPFANTRFGSVRSRVHLWWVNGKAGKVEVDVAKDHGLSKSRRSEEGIAWHRHASQSSPRVSIRRTNTAYSTIGSSQ